MIGIAVSVAVFRAVKQLNGMVGAKASNLKRLRTESDEATIKSPSFIWRAIVFPGALHEK